LCRSRCRGPQAPPNYRQKLTRRAFVARRPNRLGCADADASVKVARQKRRAA
jgi:hypothetical protein